MTNRSVGRGGSASVTAHPRRWALGVVLSADLLVYICYFLHLSADFPNGSPWNDFAKYTDEGWYGGAAVHMAQTGHWYIAGGFNPAVGLPLWPLLLAGWFHLAGGPGMVAARALAVLPFGGSLVLLYLLLRRITGQLIAALAVTLVVVNPYSFSFDRLAILEPLVVFLFLLALWVATLRPGATINCLRAAATGVLLAAAVLTKTTAVVLAPTVLYELWATGSGPIARKGEARMQRLRSHVAAHRAALLLPVIAAATATGLWALYFFALVRPYHLADFHHLFAVNAGKAHGRILLQVMAMALGDTLWINRILLSLTIVAVVASSRFLRELWKVPLYTSCVLAMVFAVGFIGWHTWFQPRYYLLCVFPSVIILALATHALRTRARRLERRSPWRIAHRVTLVLLEMAAVTMVLQTGRYLLRPTYSFRNAATSIAATVRADSSRPQLLLAGSGDDITLFTGLRTLNPEWPTDGLPALLRREQPGWYAAYLPLEAGTLPMLRAQYLLEPVAHYRVMDEPEHRDLVLYRLTRQPTAALAVAAQE